MNPKWDYDDSCAQEGSYQTPCDQAMRHIAVVVLVVGAALLAVAGAFAVAVVR